MNARPNQHNRFGLTMVEMIVSLLAASVLVLSTGAFLADNQTAFNDAYDHAYSAAAEDETTARLVFQRIVRQATVAATASVAPDGSWLQVQYRSGVDAVTPDRIARFYLSDKNLMLETIALETKQILATETVCRNVDSASFALTGDAAQMFLKVDDGSVTRFVNSSAVRRSP